MNFYIIIIIIGIGWHIAWQQLIFIFSPRFGANLLWDSSASEQTFMACRPQAPIPTVGNRTFLHERLTCFSQLAKLLTPSPLPSRASQSGYTV